MPTVEPHAEVRTGRESVGWSEDQRTIAALLAGDEAAFVALLDRYYAPMLRLAQVYVADRAVAEEVVQETWVGVFQGLAQFGGRSSLKTWIFRILTNQAQTRGKREARTVPFSALAARDADRDDPAVDPDRFNPADHARWPGHWATAPQSWAGAPEEQLLAQETRRYLKQALAGLPLAQRTVIIMRDVEGWDAPEVCNVLGITETHQRVLLHRARSKVRRALETYLTGDPAS
jgi:RNA polymerase sigma-70 factor (ECF subfamily)